MRIKWTSKEIKLLKRNAPIKNKAELLKIFLNRSWRAINIKVNRLKISRRQFQSEFKKFDFPKPSKEFAWWLGALAGDGHVAFDRIILKITDKDFAEKFKIVGENLFLIKAKIREYTMYDPKIKRKLQYVVIFYSQKLAQYLDDWSWLKWNSTLQKKFNWILEKEEYVASFLSGYLDAEGSVICKFHKKQHKFMVKYTAEPEHIKKLLSDLLSKINIKNLIYSEGVYIYGLQNLKKFAAMINSSIKRKQERLDNIKKIKVRYEQEYEIAFELKNGYLSINQISKLLEVPLPTVQNWFYKGYKPNQIIEGQV